MEQHDCFACKWDVSSIYNCLMLPSRIIINRVHSCSMSPLILYDGGHGMTVAIHTPHHSNCELLGGSCPGSVARGTGPVISSMCKASRYHRLIIVPFFGGFILLCHAICEHVGEWALHQLQWLFVIDYCIHVVVGGGGGYLGIFHQRKHYWSCHLFNFFFYGVLSLIK